MRRWLVLAVISFAVAATAQMAVAAYPDRPIRMIVAFPPGGSIDVVARILAERLRLVAGQPIVVENRAGAAGNIAAQSVAAAAPDGYTALMTTSAIAINPWMSSGSLDPVKDLSAVTRVAISPYVLVVRPTLPVKSLEDFVALAKSQPGKLTCSTYGLGSPPHLALELLKREAGIDIVHAPYRGFGQALPDLSTGLLDCAIETPANCEQHVNAGTIKAIAVTGPAPLAKFPGAKTMSALYPKVVVEGYQMILLPAAAPLALREQLAGELGRILREPEIEKRLRELGFEPVGDTPEQAGAVLKDDYERFGPIIGALKLKPE
ncbi:MAG: tripartite tricarboxylate transporter substrate binding protein [Bradyrhizobium sp.]|nr:tripartite tricarboxylate transporter substrate binding protein [Bradyrhizobium sp.]